jgi:hypothetical protein
MAHQHDLAATDNGLLYLCELLVRTGICSSEAPGLCSDPSVVMFMICIREVRGSAKLTYRIRRKQLSPIVTEHIYRYVQSPQ